MIAVDSPRQTDSGVDLAALLATAGVAALAGRVPRVRVRDVCCDSRLAAPGSLFVALPGTKADGSRFVQAAFDGGAEAVVVEREIQSADDRIVRVSDARAALARLAAAHHGLIEIQRGGGLRAVGVTGTNGKSTVAFLIRSMLRAAGHRAALFGTIEYDLVSRVVPSELTTPDPITLARELVEAHRAGASHAVMEVSSHSLAQRRTDGIAFAVGVFTNLTQDHLDYHADMDGYRLAKRRLFDALPADAFAVVNADDPASGRMLDRCAARALCFGLARGADVRAEIEAQDASGSRFTLFTPIGRAEVRTALVGRHNVSNALAAAAAGVALDLKLDAIKLGLESLRGVPGRLERVDTEGLGFSIFVDYAHTDDALRNVLSSARPFTRGRLWCVFGCGGDRDKTKRPKMARAVAECADSFVVTSDNPRTEDPLAIIADIERGLEGGDRSRCVTIPDRAAAIAHAVEQLVEGDTLIIAGKGHEDYQIIGTTKIHFADVESAAAAVARRRSP